MRSADSDACRASHAVGSANGRAALRNDYDGGDDGLLQPEDVAADAGAAVAVAECACGGDYGCLCAACVYGNERHRRFRDAYAQPRCHR